MLRLSLALKERRGLVITVGDGTQSVQPLPFRSTTLPTPAAGTVSTWEMFGKMYRPGLPVSSGPLLNPSGGPLEMGFDVSSLQGGHRFTLTLSSAGRPLQGTLHAAAFVELDGSGKIVRETRIPHLPVILPPTGGTWSISL